MTEKYTDSISCSPQITNFQAPARRTKISFIIPSYNEEETIGTVLKELKDAFRDQEILVIDDASTDNTFKIAEEICPGKVLRHIRNRGYGAALKTGLLNAAGEFAVFVDGDGQHSIEDINKVVGIITNNPELDSVLTERKNIYTSGAVRSIGKLLINQTIKKLTDKKIKDSNSGLRAFRIMKIVPFLFMLPNGFSFSTTSTVLSYKEDFNMQWIEIHMKERKHGKSHVRIRHGFDTLLLIIRLIVIFDPLRFFLPVAGASLMLGCVSIVNAVITSGTLGKNYIFFFLFGVLMFILGLLSEQISMLRKEITFVKTKNDR